MSRCSAWDGVVWPPTDAPIRPNSVSIPHEVTTTVAISWNDVVNAEIVTSAVTFRELAREEITELGARADVEVRPGT